MDITIGFILLIIFVILIIFPVIGGALNSSAKSYLSALVSGFILFLIFVITYFICINFDFVLFKI
jgi:hypothetical protein